MPDWVRIRFEIYVDGVLRGASGWMGTADAAQALVVARLEGARELRLVTRYEKFPPYPVTGAWWDIRFFKK